MCKSHRDSAGRPGCNSGSIPNAPRNSKTCYSDAALGIQRLSCRAQCTPCYFWAIRAHAEAQKSVMFRRGPSTPGRTCKNVRDDTRLTYVPRFHSVFQLRAPSELSGGRGGARRRVSHCSCSSAAPGRDSGLGANSLAYCYAVSSGKPARRRRASAPSDILHRSCNLFIQICEIPGWGCQCGLDREVLRASTPNSRGLGTRDCDQLLLRRACRSGPYCILSRRTIRLT